MNRRAFVSAAAVAAWGQPQSKIEFLPLRDSAGGHEALIAPSQGGELSSLRIRHRGAWRELLHRAKDYTAAPGWRGKAPLLFPATGRNFAPGSKPDGGDDVTGSYDLGRKRYSMPIHGFVRQMPWIPTNQTEDRVSLFVRSTEATRRYYPFDFRLTVRYRLHLQVLEMYYEVTADPTNEAEMPFSIGNHITFATPLAPGSKRDEILIQTPGTIEHLKTPEGLPTGESRPIDLSKPVPLGSFPTIPARSIGGYRGLPFLELRDPGGVNLRLEHEADSWPEEPHIPFNIWGNPRENCISPEPWVGIQNSLVLKKGLIWLKPGSSWNWRLRVRAWSE